MFRLVLTDETPVILAAMPTRIPSDRISDLPEEVERWATERLNMEDSRA